MVTDRHYSSDHRASGGWDDVPTAGNPGDTSSGSSSTEARLSAAAMYGAFKLLRLRQLCGILAHVPEEDVATSVPTK